MKNMLFVLLCIVASPLYAQNTAVSANKMNVFYIGIGNPVSVFAQGYDCKDVSLGAVDDVTVTFAERPCEFVVYVKTQGEVIIPVLVKDGTEIKTIGIHKFRAKYLPDPAVSVARKEGGTVSKTELKAQLGIVADLKGFDIEAKYKITNFYLIVIRHGKPVLSHNNQSAIFDDTTRAYIEELQKDDKVIFADIHCIGPDKKERQLAAVELTIE